MSDKKIIKVTKSYTRKVNLKAVSSQYDNIECGTIMSANIEFKDQNELNEKCIKLAEKIRRETERDIANNIQNLMDLAKDDSNSALLGLGNKISSDKTQISSIDGFDDLISEQETIQSIPSELEEVDLEDINL